MTVDLSILQKGYKVHFRCGGEAVVGEADITKERIDVSFVGEYGLYTFTLDGSNDYGHQLDIIRIEPPVFDWDTVKPGMAFNSICHEYEGTVWVIKPTNYFDSGRDDRHVIVSSCVGAILSSELYTIKHNELTRAPEHDIP